MKLWSFDPRTGEITQGLRFQVHEGKPGICVKANRRSEDSRRDAFNFLGLNQEKPPEILDDRVMNGSFYFDVPHQLLESTDNIQCAKVLGTEHARDNLILIAVSLPESGSRPIIGLYHPLNEPGENYHDGYFASETERRLPEFKGVVESCVCLIATTGSHPIFVALAEQAWILTFKSDELAVQTLAVFDSKIEDRKLELV